jgi:hypothetical protein
MEMTVVVAIVAMLAVFGLPAVRALLSSFETQGGARAMINAALASARAIAAKEHHYAGVRFQKACDCISEDPTDLLDPSKYEPTEDPQYMVFIVHDPDPHGTDLANGFRAVKGINPIKLPDSIGVMDLKINNNQEINANSDIRNNDDLIDTTSFSIIFSPSGKLVIHDVRVRNRDGETNDSSDDDIFNTTDNVSDEIATFIQDDYASLGLEEEPSRSKFIIYERVKFRQAYETGWAYSEYLKDLKDSMININPYTGTMINK